MIYQTIILLYFTGTGNSYRVASWFGEVFSTCGSAITLVPIEERDKLKTADLIGLIFPTHGFTTPWQVIRFVLGLPQGHKTPAFVAVTRAGTRLFKRELPGMEGTAGYLMALLLFCKGYRVLGVTGLDMPSNWIAVHSGINRSNAEAIINRTEPKAKNFAHRIGEGKSFFNGKIPLLLGILLWKVSLGYLLLGRFVLAKLSFASEACDGCGLCAATCPAKAIRMRGRKKLRPYWTFSCESCMRCMAYCPKEAIQSSHSFAFILGMMLTLSGSVSLSRHFVWLSGYLEGVLQYGCVLLTVYLAYQLFSLLLRIPLLNKFFAYTTLTLLYRRYRAPKVSLNQMLTPHDFRNGDGNRL